MKTIYGIAGIGALLLCIGAVLFDLTSMNALATVLMSLGTFAVLIAPIGMD